MTLTDLASWASIIALLVSLFSIAFSARTYLAQRQKEIHQNRFNIYHSLIKAISRGSDGDGQLKVVSQIAYIYELRNFPEYKDLTVTALQMLQTQWMQNAPDHPYNEELSMAIKETLSAIRKK